MEAASTDLFGVLSVRRARRRFSFASSMLGGGGFGVLVVFPVIRGLGCIISSISMSSSIYCSFMVFYSSSLGVSTTISLYESLTEVSDML